MVSSTNTLTGFTPGLNVIKNIITIVKTNNDKSVMRKAKSTNVKRLFCHLFTQCQFHCAGTQRH